MSGGVDSSVAAALLVQQGYDVVGATMKTFCYSGEEAHSKTCCGLDGIADARRVSDALGIPHYVFDVEEDFTRDVIDDFVSEYARGRTPNPCVRCNSNTKFQDLMERGRVLGCDGIASGHYVRIDRSNVATPALHRGIDASKDQSYFLWGLPTEMLPLLHFPLGDLTKIQVREQARALGLVTADKPESQEICFVPTGDYRDLLEKRLIKQHPALEPGLIVSSTGAVLGEHTGYANFTVGQRKGLGGGFGQPLYVIEIRADSREVVVGTAEEGASGGAEIGEVNWLTTPPPEASPIQVQIRYRAAAVPATVQSTDGRVVLAFEEAQRAVTPGQSAVFFQGERVLGGGRIERALVSRTLDEEVGRASMLQPG
jgi:tRNA-specific 2-thiouridylase